MSLVAPTLGDAVTSGVEGPSGLRSWDPSLKLQQKAGGATCTFSNGANMKLFGAFQKEDVERFRSGGNRCFVWCEEMAAWRFLEEAWEQIRYGLRVGPWPRAVISTTPKARKVIKNLVKRAMDDPEYGQVTKAFTFDNPHLDSRVVKELKDDYDGTRMGRQELYAEILEDVEGALWTTDMIDSPRLDLYQFPQELDRIVVGVDPQGKEGGDETGIVVAGLNRNGYGKDKRSHGFILGDYTVNASPEKWGTRVDAAFRDFLANEIVAEVNNGGDMVKSTIRAVNSSLPVHVVHATRGKDKRAEPVSALYEQQRIHHIGQFPKLEDQMVTYDVLDPDQSWSPDRMDAMVWAISRLMVKGVAGGQTSVKDDRLRGRR